MRRTVAKKLSKYSVKISPKSEKKSWFYKFKVFNKEKPKEKPKHITRETVYYLGTRRVYQNLKRDYTRGLIKFNKNGEVVLV